jgi:signal peptidase I
MQKNSDLLWYSARGESMFPFIREGDFILVKRVPLNTITPGDTILFESEDKREVCHNVAEIKRVGDVLWFHTKGYKSASYDAAPIRQDRVLGKVVALRRKNKVIDLTGADIYSFHFRLECILAEYALYARRVLGKIPQFKKVYKFFIRKKLSFKH